MTDGSDSAAGGGAHASRAALAERVRRLGEALHEAHAALAALGGEVVPGQHLAVEAAGRRALLPAAGVREIVRMVATRPVAGAPAHVLGTFVCRGEPVVAVDLSRLLGEAREPSVDAQIVILGGVPAVGLVVDRIAGLVDGPRAFTGDAGAAAASWAGAAGLVTALCVEGGEVLPLLDPAPLAAELAEGRA